MCGPHSGRAVAVVVLALVTLGARADRSSATLAWSDQRTLGVMVAADDGSGPRLVGRGTGVVVSGDGALIAYAASDRGRSEEDTYVVAGGGTIAPELLAKNTVPLAFSPDGRHLIVSRVTRAGKPKGMAAVPVDGGPPVALASRPGSVAGFGALGSVTVLIDQLDSALARVVEFSLRDGGLIRTRLAGARVNDFGAALAPDGRLAYNSSPRPQSGGVSRLRVTGGSPSVVPYLTDDDLVVQRPVAWSADGRRLLIAEQGVGINDNTAAIFDARSGRRRVIAEGLTAVYGFSKDGRFVLAGRGEEVDRVVSIPVAGGPSRDLARHAFEADWSR